MGMDPVHQGEVHEVTVQLLGPVGAAAFDKYKTEVDKFIKNAGNIQDATYNRKLQVREVKEGVRPTGA